MGEPLHSLAMVAVVAGCTLLTRALPFLLMAGRPVPPAVAYLGRVLPPAVMGVLVVYCLREAGIGHFPYGMAQWAGVALAAGLQARWGNTLVSIAAATGCYMVLAGWLA